MRGFFTEYTDIVTEDDNASDYYNSFIYDYEKYIQHYGFIPANDFIQGWNCINSKVFKLLKSGDTVYDYRGLSYEVVRKGISYVEVIPLDVPIDTYHAYPSLHRGEVYCDSVTHEDYKFKDIIKKHKEREEKICPILITKTNQAQS